MSKSNCPLPDNWEEYAINPVPSVGPLTTQQLLIIIAASGAALTTFISLFLILKHLHRYTEPKQQRQCVRIIFFPVVFSVFSALSIVDYHVAKYLQPLIDLYETFAIAALFLLFVEYEAPDPYTRDQHFAMLEHRKPKRMMFPVSGYNVIPGGSLKWLQIKYIAVFGYVMIDIAMTILKEITLATGAYCETSWKPRFFHIWYEIITNSFLGWAVLCVVIFYGRFAKEPEFAKHKPGMKLASLKLTVFINFLQSIVFSAVNVSTSAKFTGWDWTFGVPAAVVAVEQIAFAVFFHYSYRSREYHESMKQDLTPRMGTFRAAADAFNPTDLFVGMATAVKLIFGGFGKTGGSRGRPQARFDGSAHLEPMSQQTQYGYSQPPAYPQPATIGVTAPQHAYNGSETMAEPYRGQSPPGYDGRSDESSRLNPYAYARTHSRDSSVDAAEMRSTRAMV